MTFGPNLRATPCGPTNSAIAPGAFDGRCGGPRWTRTYRRTGRSRSWTFYRGAGVLTSGVWLSDPRRCTSRRPRWTGRAYWAYHYGGGRFSGESCFGRRSGGRDRSGAQTGWTGGGRPTRPWAPGRCYTTRGRNRRCPSRGLARRGSGGWTRTRGGTLTLGLRSGGRLKGWRGRKECPCAGNNSCPGTSRSMASLYGYPKAPATGYSRYTASPSPAGGSRAGTGPPTRTWSNTTRTCPATAGRGGTTRSRWAGRPFTRGALPATGRRAKEYSNNGRTAGPRARTCTSSPSELDRGVRDAGAGASLHLIVPLTLLGITPAAPLRAATDAGAF